MSTPQTTPPLNTKNLVERKNITLTDVKLDAGQPGTFTGYASTFGNEDLQGDIILPGAFKRTIDQNQGVFRLLDQHNTDWEIGIVRATEDQRGLLVNGEFYVDSGGDPANEVRRAREAYVKMQRRQAAGMPQQFSIGYRAINPRFENGKRYLAEIGLAEVSTVTFPANPEAVTTGVKSAADLAKAFGEAYARAIEANAPWEAIEIAFDVLKSSVYDAVWGGAPETDRVTLLTNDLTAFQDAILQNVQAINSMKSESRDAIEGSAAALKAGRVLSQANIDRLRRAQDALTPLMEALQEVLDSAADPAKSHSDDQPVTTPEALDDPLLAALAELKTSMQPPAPSLTLTDELRNAAAMFKRRALGDTHARR